MDRIGTRRGLTLTVLGYSIVSMLTSLAQGLYSLASFRFLLGAGGLQLFFVAQVESTHDNGR